MFVLDTNTIIYFFKGIGHVAEHLARTPPAEIAVPSVAVYELEFGIARSGSKRRQAQLEEFLRLVSIWPFARDEARAAAQIRAGLESSGTPIGPYDVLIAATALARQATLVTRNLGEFQRIQDLAVVNWFDPPEEAVQ